MYLYTSTARSALQTMYIYTREYTYIFVNYTSIQLGQHYKLCVCIYIYIYTIIHTHQYTCIFANYTRVQLGQHYKLCVCVYIYIHTSIHVSLLIIHEYS